MPIHPFAGAPAKAALGTAAAVAAVASTVAFWRKTLTPSIIAQPSSWNQALISLCPHLTAPYTLPAFLNNGHVETIFAALFRKSPHVMYDRELVHMPDGGVVALDTEDLPPSAASLPPNAPVLILLPGLTGGSEDSYVQHAVVHAREAGIRAVVFNSRGTSGSPVVTAQFYSASYTEDLRCVVGHVGTQYPGAPLFAAGWSLGANILMRYLGEEGKETPVRAAVAMCNPFNLPMSDTNFQKGFNRIYDANLAKSLRRIYSKHHHLFEAAAASGERAYDPKLALAARTVREFDDAITKVSFGWPDVDAYYAGSSSALTVHKIAVPVLVIQAEDDPIAPKAAIPTEALQANPNCMLVLTPTGGHLGWCSGDSGVRGAPWSDRAVVEYFSAVQKMWSAEQEAEAEKHPAMEREGVFTSGSGTHQAP